MTKQTIGEFMATLRKANGYTQQEVAEKLNVSNRTLSSWETDRTLPDVLMLPAIADLYNVSVDELLRGERSNAESKNAEISESALKNVYKNKYGAFTAKYSLILGLALICAAVFALGSALALWTKIPALLDWILLMLGLVGTCACIAMLCYHYNTAKLSAGVVLDEDLTNDKKAFISALRHKLENFFLLCALPFALFAIVVLDLFIIIDPTDSKVFEYTFYVRNGYIFVIVFNFALALILLATFFILKSITVKRYYSETQKDTAKVNRKFAGKLAAFGAIPVAIAILFNVALSIAVFAERKSEVLYKCDNLEAFKTHLHTIKIDADEYEHIPEGEYYLAFPDKPEYNTEYDLGNGFIGVLPRNHITDYGNTTKDCWSIYYYNAPNNAGEMPSVDTVGTFYAHGYGKDVIVNARYHEYDYTYYNDSLDNTYRTVSHIIEGNDGQYVFESYDTFVEVSSTMRSLMISTLMFVPVISVIVCVIIFAAKRKKQKYRF